MPPTAPTSAPATPAPAKTEAELLRQLVSMQVEQLAELKSRLDSIAPASRVKRDAPKFAKAPWEEVIWVEALQLGYYPDPPKEGEMDYNRAREPREEWQDGETKRWQVKRGSIFRLKHREHLSEWMCELQSEDEDIPATPKKAIPATSARGQVIKHY